MRYITTQKQGKTFRYLLRGDSEGKVIIWTIPEVSNTQLQQIQQEVVVKPVQMTATLTTSLTHAWANMFPSPVGILDQLDKEQDPPGLWTKTPFHYNLKIFFFNIQLS